MRRDRGQSHSCVCTCHACWCRHVCIPFCRCLCPCQGLFSAFCAGHRDRLVVHYSFYHHFFNLYLHKLRHSNLTLICPVLQLLELILQPIVCVLLFGKSYYRC